MKVGKPKDAEAAKRGTKLSRGANFKCLMSDAPMAGDYIYSEGKAGRMGARLMAIVAEGDRGRVYRLRSWRTDLPLGHAPPTPAAPRAHERPWVTAHREVGRVWAGRGALAAGGMTRLRDAGSPR